jgi:outer membrane protein insertion porin family
MKRLSIIALLFIVAFALCAQEADQGSAAPEGTQAPAEDWFWGRPIASVQWVGLVHADRRELDSVTKDYIGKAFTEELWIELQQRLYELDWFDTIDPTAVPADTGKNRVIIKFLVTERPSIEAVRIVGNSGVRAADILEAVTEKAGDIYIQAKTKVDELAVRRLYLEKGYPDVSVSSGSSAGKDENSVVLSFVVSEGAQVAVREIRFTGNTAVSSQTLKSQMGLKEAGFLQSGAFQESKLEEDKLAIVDYYRGRGFIDAAIVDVVRGYEKDPKTSRTRLILTLAIREGRQWTIGAVAFEGNKIFATEKLAAIMTQKAGNVLNFRKLSQDKQKIDDLYYESGYIFNQIDLVESRDEEKGSISYVVKIIERDRAHIESIAFAGNKKTKDYVLYREMPLEVGDIFSKAKVVEGLRNLYNLQYFSYVGPEMSQGSAEGLMNLVIEVEEQSTADIQFGVTLSGLGQVDTFPVSGLVKWNDRNFLGRGLDLGVEANGSPTEQSVTFSYSDRYFFGKKFSGGIDLSIAHKTKQTAQDIVAPIFDDGVPDPFTESVSGGYSLSQVPSAYQMPYQTWDLSLGFSTGYSVRTPLGDLGAGGAISLGLGQKTYDESKYRPASRDIREALNAWLLGNKIVARGYLNNLDLWYNPTSGYYASQRFSMAGIVPIETQHYLKSETKIEFYATLWNLKVLENWSFKGIFGAHTGLSFLGKKPWADLAVTDDWLYLDGTFNARGWRNLYGLEGTSMWENWLELRIPIFEQILWVDGFFDAAAMGTQGGLVDMNGASGDSGMTPVVDASRPGMASLGWENFAYGLGFGFRFAIPQFPFRFYFVKRFTLDGESVQWRNPGNLDFVISISQPLN